MMVCASYSWSKRWLNTSKCNKPKNPRRQPLPNAGLPHAYKQCIILCWNKQRLSLLSTTGNKIISDYSEYNNWLIIFFDIVC